MKTLLRIVLAQINLTSGDIDGNLKKIIHSAETARDSLHANVIVFPELAITSYLHEDLALRKSFIIESNAALKKLLNEVHGIYCVVGHPFLDDKGLQNSCSVIYNGKIVGRAAKQNLPNYGVFDENRYYQPSKDVCVVPIDDTLVGIIICEDIWHDQPIKDAAKLGARFIICTNASPFESNKHEERQFVLEKRAASESMPIVYVNHICGQDDVVFDGGSMVVDHRGKICQHAGFFNEVLIPVDLEITKDSIHIASNNIQIPTKDARIYNALVLGVRDYVQKNNFKGALIGVSGGIDSALALAIAVDALGKDYVNAVFLPSRYTSDMSHEDAALLAKNLDVSYQNISIEPAYQAFLKMFGSENKLTVTEENIQARCRGLTMMALSNQSGRIVLTTGNRSELAVGYATLYGDMAGGFNILKDVTKTEVYNLAHYRNQQSHVIPDRIIERPPTAELAPNQKDEDSLPPYSVLDAILVLYLNEELSTDEIIAQGYPEKTVLDVVQLIKKNEYKRRQAPPGVRINHKAFGRDRRYPITQGFKK